MEDVKENAEAFNTLDISLQKQSLLLAFNSKAWEGKEPPPEWEQQVKGLLKEREQRTQSILNLARHLTLDSGSILIWKIKKPRLGRQTDT